jgi:hypothetical protein
MSWHSEASLYFWSHLDDRSTECMPWPYGTTRNGYGAVMVNGRSHLVHRLACMNRWGPPPGSGYVAAHLPVICHNGNCWNGYHQLWVMYAENSAHIPIDASGVLPDALLARYAVGKPYESQLFKIFDVKPEMVLAEIRNRHWTGPGSRLTPEKFLRRAGAL